MTAAFPIDDVLPDLLKALHTARRAVLQAPPGAGKTTRVPLALLESGLAPGRIILLEPRRLAARAAAERMAQTLGTPLGKTIGYRIRGEAKTSPTTRIEVVTEGILTRMLQSDPELPGVSAIIFDEFHERSIQADLGLALSWEVRQTLREDLILLVMSATLDAAPVAEMLDRAPIITSQGQAFPVTTHWLERPTPQTQRFETAMADLVAHAVAKTQGGVLAFLPGEGEIHRTQALLQDRLPTECQILPLYGALPFPQQQQAIRPMTHGRKIVLATAIAETSLTIQDIRVVVDGGRARRARFDPNTAMSRLVSERVTRAEAEQRRGRAGRVAEGHCYRLWTRGEEGALAAFPPPEIEATDLTPLALELAQWGAAPDTLALLTQPNAGALAEARKLLEQIGALHAGRITDHGRALAALPLHPRLAHMLQIAGPQAAPLAALLSERDPLSGRDSDLGKRLQALDTPPKEIHRPSLNRIRAEAKRLARISAKSAHKGAMSTGEMAALAYPDRIGLRRKGDDPRYLLSGGRGAMLAPDDPQGTVRLIVVSDIDGAGREARIRRAAPISESELRALYPAQIAWHTGCAWSKRDRKVIARRQERFGALVLADQIWKDAPPEALAIAMLEGVRELGLPWSDAARRFQARIMLLQAQGADLPDLSETALMATLDDWLLPHLSNVTSAEDLKRFDMLPAVRAMLDWPQQQLADLQAPAHFMTPLGNKIPIDYSGDTPGIEVRLQELFGLTRHPTIGPANLPLRLTLLSPARRPVQTTMDLPGFWANSYADVRKDMRGRYLKHPWPEDPTQADPTLRAKPRRR